MLTSTKPDLSTKHRIFYIYFVATAALLLWILRPFATTLMVAAVLTVWARPVYQRWLLWQPKHPHLLAAGLTMVIVLVVLTPLAWALTQTLIQVQDVAENVSNLVANPQKMAWIMPLVEHMTNLTGIPVNELPGQLQKYMSEGTGTLVRIVGAGAKEAIGATTKVGLSFFILIFALYTFLIHTDSIIKKIKSISPLDDKLEDELIVIFQGFSRSIVMGGFVTAIAQGFVAGLGYALFGIEEAFFWGTITAFFSFVPFVGTALIWLPLVISLAMQGQSGSAFGLAAYSLLITGSIDNFLKPFLIGQNSSLHPLLLFLSIFGGLMTLGAAGILIGPITASFFLALAQAYEREKTESSAVLPQLPQNNLTEAEASKTGEPAQN